MTSQELSAEELGEMALAAFQEAVARVMEDHRRRRKPIAIWKDGRVVLKLPDAPREIQESPAPYETRSEGYYPGQNGADKDL